MHSEDDVTILCTYKRVRGKLVRHPNGLDEVCQEQLTLGAGLEGPLLPFSVRERLRRQPRMCHILPQLLVVGINKLHEVLGLLAWP